jgi:hypothetical protein
MKNWLAVVAASAIALAVVGCAKQVPIQKTEMADKGTMEKKAEPKMEAKMMDEKAIKAVFKNGGQCTWTAGSEKGEDFYYTTASPSSGAADRMLGQKMVQGSWAIKGDKLCLNYGKDTCYSLAETGKGAFKATPASGAAVDFKC